MIRNSTLRKDFKLLGMQVFNIDFNKQEELEGVSRITDFEETNEFSEFLKSQFFNIMINETYKKFKYNPESIVIKSIESILNNSDIDLNSHLIAKRLWVSEVKSNERQKKTLKNQVLKGNLILSQIETDEAFHFIIIKMEHHNYFQDGNYRKQSGIPEEKAILKSFFTSYSKQGNNAYNIKIKDPSSAVFWKRDFLSLEEEFTSDKNVKNCFDFLTKKIGFKFSKFPKEKNTLLNATHFYFCSNSTFDLEDYLKTIIISHNTKTQINMKDFSDKLTTDISNNRKFDTQFSLDEVDDITLDLKALEYKVKEGISIKIVKPNNKELEDIFESVEINGKKAIAIYNPDSDIYEEHKKS